MSLIFGFWKFQNNFLLFWIKVFENLENIYRKNSEMKQTIKLLIVCFSWTFFWEKTKSLSFFFLPNWKHIDWKKFAHRLTLLLVFHWIQKDSLTGDLNVNYDWNNMSVTIWTSIHIAVHSTWQCKTYAKKHTRSPVA